MREREKTWDERVQDWLNSLDQPLRTAAEAVVDEYLNPVRYEPIGVAEGWTPQAGVRYGITVNLDREEISMLKDGLGPEVSPIALMKDMLLKRAQAILADRTNAGSDDRPAV